MEIPVYNWMWMLQAILPYDKSPADMERKNIEKSQSTNHAQPTDHFSTAATVNSDEMHNDILFI